MRLNFNLLDKKYKQFFYNGLGNLLYALSERLPFAGAGGRWSIKKVTT
jgi:hypothetical protein